MKSHKVKTLVTIVLFGFIFSLHSGHSAYAQQQSNKSKTRKPAPINGQWQVKDESYGIPVPYAWDIKIDKGKLTITYLGAAPFGEVLPKMDGSMSREKLNIVKFSYDGKILMFRERMNAQSYFDYKFKLVAKDHIIGVRTEHDRTFPYLTRQPLKMQLFKISDKNIEQDVWEDF